MVERKVAGSSWRANAAAVSKSILLAGTCLSPVAVAQTWTSGAGTNDWGTESNWSPATVPSGSGAIAQFGASGRTTVNGTNVAVDTIQFNAGAPTYTVALTGGSLTGSGIVNNSGRPQNVNFPGVISPGDFTTFIVNNNASLGNANSVVNWAQLVFYWHSTAGNATITAQASSLIFRDYATAGTATIVLDPYSSLVYIFNTPSQRTHTGNVSGDGLMSVNGSGTLTITGNISLTGKTTVAGTKLVVNGSISGTVELLQGATLSGSGSVGHATLVNGALDPGNSIGTLNIGGNLVKHRGHYHVELDGQSRSDRINVGGTATLHSGTVLVLPDPGLYANSTTYTILSAAGGVSGAYSGISSDFAFMTPTLSYDANNVYLTLALQGAAFSGFSGNTPNQRAVGYALDQSYASASGDYATVIGALAGLSTAQGSAALSAISSQPWANFGTTNLASNTLFMNTVGQQMATARGSVVASGGQRQALAQACDVAACDSASPFTVWGSALGGVGSVLGDSNAATLTYNLGGGAAGIDYRVTPNILLGIGTAYTSGTQWADGFMGKGWNNAVSVAAYGSFTQGGFYADLLAGYAYANNQLQRQIMVPNLQPRTANGSTGVNQFLGQAELGYQVPVYAPASATVTPFARFQVMSANQAAFSEWGANSLSLNVAQQTTNSVRSTLGMDLGGAIGLANGRSFDMALRLGWLHEYADVSRPITAAFAGAPGAAFTVYGAASQRDAAVIGFQAGTTVSDGAKIYVRYDGDIGTSVSNHALSAGLRLAF